MSPWRRLIAAFETLVDSIKMALWRITHLPHLRHLRRNEAGLVRVTSVARMAESAEVVARVKRGAALLDEKRPGWDREVNPMTLRIASASDCVLGQTYGDYTTGLRKIGLLGQDDSEYGFNAEGAVFFNAAKWHDYMALNREWAAEIAQRRARQRAEV